jgi:Cu(I)/Ag(I) efflux system membrane fusion protein
VTRRWCVALAAGAIAIAGASGYFVRDFGLLERYLTRGKTASPVEAILYYRDPDNRPFYSATPTTTPDGRPYRAVATSEEPRLVEVTQDQTLEGTSTRRILHYRHPMGLPDVSPVPKKDSMGMDYIAVYEGEGDESGTVRLSPARIQRTGVVTEVVAERVLAQTIRAPGTIQLDERRISVISLRTEAFVESVENITTGSEVRQHQPLMRLYSPVISGAAAEYAAVAAGGREAGRGSRQKLANMLVPEDVIAEIESSRRAPLSLTWTAPRDGVVLERNVAEGMRVNPGDVLFRIGDHSIVWAVVDIPESQLARLAPGQRARIQARAFPGRAFAGTVDLVYPKLDAATRSARIRIELPNPGFALRPDMYVLAEIDTGDGMPRSSVPESAVIDSGDRQLVLLDRGEGRFEQRAVRTGVRSGTYVEVLEGVVPGDRIVTSANFLIDAESNLKAALKALVKSEPAQ